MESAKRSTKVLMAALRVELACGNTNLPGSCLTWNYSTLVAAMPRCVIRGQIPLFAAPRRYAIRGCLSLVAEVDWDVRSPRWATRVTRLGPPIRKGLEKPNDNSVAPWGLASQEAEVVPRKK